MTIENAFRDVYVITERYQPKYVLGVFTTRTQALDYIEHEVHVEAECIKRPGVLLDSDRVVLLDTSMNDLVFEYATDYTSEPTRRRQELREQAISKLTPEEAEALGVRKPAVG